MASTGANYQTYDAGKPLMFNIRDPHQRTLIPAIPFWEVIFLKLSQIVYLFAPRTNYYSRSIRTPKTNLEAA
jgi:hypothetical protein